MGVVGGVSRAVAGASNLDEGHARSIRLCRKLAAKTLETISAGFLAPFLLQPELAGGPNTSDSLAWRMASHQEVADSPREHCPV